MDGRVPCIPTAVNDHISDTTTTAEEAQEVPDPGRSEKDNVGSEHGRNGPRGLRCGTVLRTEMGTGSARGEMRQFNGASQRRRMPHVAVAMSAADLGAQVFFIEPSNLQYVCAGIVAALPGRTQWRLFALSKILASARRDNIPTTSAPSSSPPFPTNTSSLRRSRAGDFDHIRSFIVVVADHHLRALLRLGATARALMRSLTCVEEIEIARNKTSSRPAEVHLMAIARPRNRETLFSKYTCERTSRITPDEEYF
ncbi:hypothetical protein DFH09DRAFT_1097773 [Mycena vulgaris]|nr:hypothetical protein DFH09DRAFT_1097773 [Mycena vulgaris]